MNKVLMWVLIGAGALCLICGGVMFLGGRTLFKAGAELQQESETYADGMLSRVGKEWDPAELKKEASDEFLKATSDEALAGFMNLIRTKLGAYKSHSTFKMSNINMQNNNGVSTTNITLAAPGQFEKGPGNIEIDLVKRDDTWKVVNLNIKSDLLKGPAPAESRADDTEKPESK